MEQVTTEYYTITASSEFRERERLYEKARHDEAQALYHAKQEGKQEEKNEIARKMKAMDTPLDQIMLLTGLGYAEIERL